MSRTIPRTARQRQLAALDRRSARARATAAERRQRALDSLVRAGGFSSAAGELQAKMPFNVPTAAVGAAPARRSRRRRRRAGILVRVRSLGTWALSFLVVVALVSLALLSVVLNTIVIERSVELGKLDEARRTFRTENAMLSAEIAKLSAPPRVVARAGKRLDMVPSTAMATFIYLDPAAVQQAKRDQRKRAARQAKVASAVTRGESILTGSALLAPAGAEFGPPRALDGDGGRSRAG